MHGSPGVLGVLFAVDDQRAGEPPQRRGRILPEHGHRPLQDRACGHGDGVLQQVRAVAEVVGQHPGGAAQLVGHLT